MKTEHCKFTYRNQIMFFPNYKNNIFRRKNKNKKSLCESQLETRKLNNLEEQND